MVKSPILRPLFVLVLIAAACGGDSDDGGNNEVATSSPSTVVSSGGGDNEPSSGLGGLILEESYLRGTWCSEGANYVVDDNGVKIGPLDPMTIEAVFGNPNLSLVSSSDDEFVVLQSVREVTFIRGSC